jgi:hypothetical protein
MGREKNYNPNSREAIFKRLYGVKPDTFEKMAAIPRKEYEAMRSSGGSPSKLSIEDKLAVALKYLREYRTMESIGADYGVSKSTVSETIHRVENTLSKDTLFRLPEKRILKTADDSIEYIVVDVTESPIQGPEKDQKAYYSGKKSGIR